MYLKRIILFLALGVALEVSSKESFKKGSYLSQLKGLIGGGDCNPNCRSSDCGSLTQKRSQCSFYLIGSGKFHKFFGNDEGQFSSQENSDNGTKNDDNNKNKLESETEWREKNKKSEGRKGGPRIDQSFEEDEDDDDGFFSEGDNKQEKNVSKTGEEPGKNLVDKGEEANDKEKKEAVRRRFRDGSSNNPPSTDEESGNQKPNDDGNKQETEKGVDEQGNRNNTDTKGDEDQEKDTAIRKRNRNLAPKEKSIGRKIDIKKDGNRKDNRKVENKEQEKVKNKEKSKLEDDDEEDDSFFSK